MKIILIFECPQQMPKINFTRISVGVLDARDTGELRKTHFQVDNSRVATCIRINTNDQFQSH
jgi:hypothetical protein